MPNDSTIDNDSRGPTTHDLKCWPEFFAATANGSKTFEVRKNVLSGMGIEPGYVCMATALIEEEQ